jgi:YggT family protein
MGAFTTSATQILSMVGGIFLLAVLLRFLLQIARADFYNPVSQAVIKITDPVVRILRNFVPGYKGIDFSTFMVAFLVEILLIVALINLGGFQMPGIGRIVTWAAVGVIAFIINIYYWAIIASIVMSFIMMFSGTMSPHPALRLIWQLTEPVMAPVRKMIPPMGGLDFSPILIFIVINLIRNLLIQSFGLTPAIRTVIVGI